MSHITDDDIVAALRRAVPEPPEAPARLATVRRRAANRRRAQLSAGSLGAVAVLAAGVVGFGAANHGASHPAVSTPLVPVPPGIPAALGRPLHLPRFATGMPCPVSAAKTYPAGAGFSGPYSAVGAGPFTLTGNGTVEVDFTPPADDSFAGTGWPGMKVIWRLGAEYAGPVLLRGARLDGPGELRFGSYTGVVDQPASSSGSPQSQAYAELGYPSEGSVPAVLTYPSDIRVQSPGCYGLQVDGTNFSDVITFAVTAAPAN
jgi:hypothetical protein